MNKELPSLSDHQAFKDQCRITHQDLNLEIIYNIILAEEKLNHSHNVLTALEMYFNLIKKATQQSKIEEQRCEEIEFRRLIDIDGDDE